MGIPNIFLQLEHNLCSV